LMAIGGFELPSTGVHEVKDDRDSRPAAFRRRLAGVRRSAASRPCDRSAGCSGPTLAVQFAVQIERNSQAPVDYEPL
jgi:hypothetical protein